MSLRFYNIRDGMIIVFLNLSVVPVVFIPGLNIL